MNWKNIKTLAEKFTSMIRSTSGDLISMAKVLGKSSLLDEWVKAPTQFSLVPQVTPPMSFTGTVTAPKKTGIEKFANAEAKMLIRPTQEILRRLFCPERKAARIGGKTAYIPSNQTGKEISFRVIRKDKYVVSVRRRGHRHAPVIRRSIVPEAVA